MRHRLSLCSEVMKTSGPADGHQREREREIHHLNTEVLSHITGDENTHNISWIRQTKHHNTSFTQRESCEITWRLLLNVESVYLLQWTHTHIHTLTHIQTGRHTNIFNNTQTGRHTHITYTHTWCLWWCLLADGSEACCSSECLNQTETQSERRHAWLFCQHNVICHVWCVQGDDHRCVFSLCTTVMSHYIIIMLLTAVCL